MNTDLEPLYLYILSRLPVRQLGTYSEWLEKAGSFETICTASDARLKELGFGLELIIKLKEIQKDWSAEKLAASLERTAVSVLTYTHSNYPKLLKEIYDAPPVLFYRGKLGDQKEACIAIVGSRKMTAYGLTIMPKITNPLLDRGLTIVSGMAYGIDTVAHNECIKRNARTIAVLGSGVDEDSVYPRAHLRLSHEILDNEGLLISEQPPGTAGLKQNFIARNRIIAGLSLGVAVVECKTKSGALLTADYAVDFNRNLYAVPGPIYSSLSAGPHQLIRGGAMLVENGEDILNDLQISLASLPLKSRVQISEPEKRVLECIKQAPMSFEEIMRAVNASAAELTVTMTSLEIKGALKQIDNKIIFDENFRPNIS